MTSPSQPLRYAVWSIANFLDHRANPLLGSQRNRSFTAKCVRNGAFADASARRNIRNGCPSHQRTFTQVNDSIFIQEWKTTLGKTSLTSGGGKICQTGLMQTIAGFGAVVNLVASLTPKWLEVELPLSLGWA